MLNRAFAKRMKEWAREIGDRFPFMGTVTGDGYVITGHFQAQWLPVMISQHLRLVIAFDDM